MKLNATLPALTAIANPRRLQVLDWLRDPVKHFPPQVDGDLLDDGVCSCSIADKLGISQPTLSEHMRILVDAKLIKAKKIKQWIFYKRDETRLDALKKQLTTQL